MPYYFSNTSVVERGFVDLHVLPPLSYCCFCGAKKFQSEPRSFCCDNGKIRLAESVIPTGLMNLFTDNESPKSIEFRSKVRVYDCIFSFTSFGVKVDKELASSRRGVYTFRVQGQIFHTLPPLVPREDGPCYFQLFFWDSDNELYNRMNIMGDADLEKGIMLLLMDALKRNPYAELLSRINVFSSIDDIRLHICKNAVLDQRRYNSPTADQVAAIWVEGNDPNISYDRDIVIYGHDGRTHKIQHYFGCYDPLQYPLLFPNGENGWHQHIPKLKNSEINAQSDSDVLMHVDFSSLDDVVSGETQNSRRSNEKMVSCREYYCYKLQIRDNSTSVILYAGRLLQKFVVDMYIKLETTRLDYYRRNQAEMRSDLYQGIVDSVFRGETRGSEVGQRIVLPGSFIGGPRDMHRRYLDAIALVRVFGKPDLFITMTCNPDWREITDNLFKGQRAQDRPDLTSRVFRAKLLDLKDQIIRKSIFGHVSAYVYTIEFQKRGLPHVHMLVILKHDYKINSSDMFDNFVSAELPNKNTHPCLFKLVVRHMMHGPCGNSNKKNSCMVEGRCKNRYPRQFCEKSALGENGYPTYRRRDDGQIVDVRKAKLNSQWVVPYNPYLLYRYDCHLNVEVCSGVTAVKYLYKYIYKGHDRVAVNLVPPDLECVDEIKNFQDARWVSAPEAMWRIFEFDLNEISPAVINLPLHLPNKHCVTFWRNQNLRSLLHLDQTSKTMLTEFFYKCSIDDKAKNLLYSEFPEHYVWDKQGKCWLQRKHRKVIGRINNANPIEGERYYLRLLLLHVRGPRSFDDLLTANRHTCFLFKEAAQLRGLLESDNGYFESLHEAVSFQMPNALRRLFATILVYCEPSDVRKMWDTFYNHLSEDFRRQDYIEHSYLLSETLCALNLILESMRKNIDIYDLPRIPINTCNSGKTVPREILDEISIDVSSDNCLSQSRLNVGQREAFNIILEYVNSGKQGLFFVHGPGGAGKTFLYRALLANVRSRKMIALATATSGVAASILPGGRTSHSRFKIPIKLHERSVCTISKQCGLAELLRRARLIIWDEAPMASRLAIEAVDRTLQDIVGIREPFGGKVVVL
ncbi:uncharacterized protein [Primulina huaijiensis]|uniref:uncharacterized protein n=1 Tax=Primulina huaijiensis TaxID=1492673 RepID=UPI003CC6E256